MALIVVVVVLVLALDTATDSSFMTYLIYYCNEIIYSLYDASNLSHYRSFETISSLAPAYTAFTDAAASFGILSTNETLACFRLYSR